jgi:hypothetical protein
MPLLFSNFNEQMAFDKLQQQSQQQLMSTVIPPGVNAGDEFQVLSVQPILL